MQKRNEVVLGDLRNFTCLGQLAMVLPFNERFRGDVFPPQYWNIIDKDGDGYNWEAYNNPLLLLCLIRTVVNRI